MKLLEVYIKILQIRNKEKIQKENLLQQTGLEWYFSYFLLVEKEKLRINIAH